MKVLLQQDVKGTGAAGDIVNVSDGYARNFLIPRKLAVPADAGNINAANIKKNAAKHRIEVQRKNAKELASGMSNLTVRVYAKAGDGGRLFGSVTGKEIADALKEQYDITVDKKKIRIPEPIKQTGIVTVSAHMFEQTDAQFKVEVIALDE
ncbi:MAG: 50S ribosomal protein L9 [Clostridia bacterium]|jgi:large subunit ribosomal protein L9|nr:50S ribosomal protein L9 [Clostridia bacterium]MBR4659303.1 50S ribosomal protein L9 [Clostridia bacterium]MBR6108822.1 50S ribosomal protein L9 [Clostridia bacterium]